MPNVKIQFENAHTDYASKEYGPYEYAQLTYNQIDIGDGKILAHMREDGMWEISEGLAYPNDVVHAFTDVVIYPVN